MRSNTSHDGLEKSFPMLIHDPLEYWSVVNKEIMFARDEQASISYSDMAASARRLARVLIGFGMRPGDRIAVLASNCIELLRAYYATSYAGLTIVPINPRLVSDERRYLLEDSEAKVLFVTADLFDRADMPVVEAPRVVLLNGQKEAGCEHQSELLQTADDSIALPAVGDSDDALQVYTSGTTGRPRAAILTHRALSATHFLWQMQGLRLESGDVFYVAMPATLGAGLYTCLNVICNGASLWLAPRFDSSAAVNALSDGGSAATAMAPTMLQACLNTEGIESRDFSRLKWILYGAAPMPAPLLRQAMGSFRCEFFQAFGQTEFPPVSMLTPADHRAIVAGEERLSGSVGRTQLGVRLEILDQEGQALPTGALGEICVRGASGMRGYWKAPELITDAPRNGWHHTGDIGYLDDEGYLFVVDRMKDMIISGGMNVYPREVERVIEAFDEVEQVAVIGVPSETWGEEVKAVIMIKSGGTLDSNSVIARCREKMAGYKVPKSVNFVEHFELSANGKVLKTVLREQFGDAPER
jgi:acyl-CoA synthetase (AMP-forming)/AMP-acid ligase II